MKVVLFCGGLGMRLREHSDAIPKPMVNVGSRPILWHLMKYYAHFGHKEFILCLGWKAEYVKEYFLTYNECISNNFTLQGNQVSLHSQDIHDWSITFVDTGQSAVVGERLQKVRPYLQGDARFLANYADGLSNVPLPEIIDQHEQMSAIATCLCVKPTQTFHLMDLGEDGLARRITPVSGIDQWMNGGFFVLDQEIFDYMQPGEDLACQPFQRLIERRKLACYRYEGFWGCMDTFKEKQALDEMFARGDTPWELWNPSRMVDPQEADLRETSRPSRPR